MTKTLKLVTAAAAAGLALLVASPAYAFLGGVPGPNGAYTDQRTNACCVSDGGKSDWSPITGHGPPKGRVKKSSGGGGPPSNDHVGAGGFNSNDVGDGRD